MHLFNNDAENQEINMKTSNVRIVYSSYIMKWSDLLFFFTLRIWRELSCTLWSDENDILTARTMYFGIFCSLIIINAVIVVVVVICRRRLRFRSIPKSDINIHYTLYTHQHDMFKNWMRYTGREWEGNNSYNNNQQTANTMSKLIHVSHMIVWSVFIADFLTG